VTIDPHKIRVHEDTGRLKIDDAAEEGSDHAAAAHLEECIRYLRPADGKEDEADDVQGTNVLIDSQDVEWMPQAREGGTTTVQGPTT